MNHEGKRVAILVGGGPAPGINSVIGTATILLRLADVPVVGIPGGFEGVMKGDVSRAVPLEIGDVSRIHFTGGSYLGTSRANPTKDPALLDGALQSLEQLRVTHLITIGGDDTAFSAMKLSERAGDRLCVAHVPKTIDNDLDLPPNIVTFGFQSARHIGVQVVKNLMVDADTTTRWFFAIAMGRKAGHLALGIGKAAGATLTLIPEEFKERPIKLRRIVDTLVGAIIKRRANGTPDGVAVIAEGVVLSIAPEELAETEAVERDEHGHVRLAEIQIGTILKQAVKRSLGELRLATTIVDKNIGYELRCADPTPYDLEYTRDLGYCAARYLLDGGTGAMITLQGGRFVPVPLPDLLDPETGRTRVRMVDVSSTGYAIARRYMIRLRRGDFEDPLHLTRLAATAGMTTEAFRERFEYLVEDEPPRAPLTNSGH